MRFIIYLILLIALPAWAQDTNSKAAPDMAKMTSRERLQMMTATTPAYQREALRLVIEEANRVARELNLAETLPITESNLVAQYISPPRMFGFGNITTSNYVYYVTVGKKFSYLEQAGLEGKYRQLQKQYLWPVEQMDTNGAYQLATQFLVAASMDVAGLNRDGEVRIETFMPEGKAGKHFVPVYWVYWMGKMPGTSGNIAQIELFQPTKTLLQLRVNQPEYILRPPLQITNLDNLLAQTNALPDQKSAP